MVATWIASIVMLSGAQGGTSLLRQIVPSPTGINGYEDYLSAADAINDGQLDDYLSWSSHQYQDYLNSFTPGPDMSPEEVRELKAIKPDAQKLARLKRLSTMNFLEVRREAKKHYEKALQFLHRGSTKKAWDPRQKIVADTLMPEYTYFKSLAKLAKMASFAAFADGDTKEGTEILIDTLALGYNLQNGILISNLVGTAIQAIAMAAFERNLQNISVFDAKTIETRVGAMLGGNPLIVDSIKREFQFSIDAFNDMLDKVESIISNQGVNDDLNAGLKQKLKSLTPAQKESLSQKLRSELMPKYQEIVAQFSKPESEWGKINDQEEASPDETLANLNTPDQFVEYWSRNLLPVFGQVGQAAAKLRAQLRLLRLHAAVLRYKWENGSMPKTLEDAVARKDTIDPLNGQLFVYEQQPPWGFRIYSLGSPQLGQIELKYRRPANFVPQDSGPVPPLLTAGP
ncbi:MAG: hypothetical protein BGO01_13710 [Armatimonadetes bacterium 55-13]|nr:hypothetical protein [Armatimonadota bacterium]OJU64783.1 MAG: hypothetical protein BGO01_13710 [Armatimonadetes bacterium 55-13]